MYPVYFQALNAKLIEGLFWSLTAYNCITTNSLDNFYDCLLMQLMFQIKILLSLIYSYTCLINGMLISMLEASVLLKLTYLLLFNMFF